ncbi:MAG TPA: hypothetical protein DDW50_16535 [Firmicutes bacterium]|nr:hypothetical protein [Bacillota bacterium]
MRFKVTLGIAIVGFIFWSSVAIGASGDLLSLENKYIKVYLNNSVEDTGRFAVDVTGGDPSRSDDDGKALIYGHPKPWTSFTTLRINGTDYVFGKATKKRSGYGLPDGQITQAPKTVDNSLIMECTYGAVKVQQSLDIARSPSTGAFDTARIKYIIVNTGKDSAEVGLRTLLDTMLGDNDGAAFRIGNKAVTTDYVCNGNDMPDFWQAFDSLTKPAVIAQGTLKGGDVTPPDRLIFTNWGKAADNPWNFQVDPNADFTRFGEDELDSAVAMYWEPRTLNPGGQISVVIYYGLGGITFAPGKTFLGISAPAEVQYSINETRKYTIMMYLEHHGEVKADNVKISLDLPQGLRCSSGKTTIIIPELVPGVTKQFSWEIEPTGDYRGDTSFQIQVSGNHLESNGVTRKIKIIGPPELKATMTLPKLKIVSNQWDPYPAMITTNIKNIGESAVYDLKATLVSETGVALATGECSDKYLLTLDGGAETTVSWWLAPTGESKTGALKVVITGTNIKPVTVDAQLEVPMLTAKLGFVGPEKWITGHVVELSLYAYNLQDPGVFSTNVIFDPKQLKLVYISRGTFLVQDNELAQWHSGVIDNEIGRVADIGGTRTKPLGRDEVTMFRLNFIVIGTGTGKVDLDALKVFNPNGNELHCDFTPFQYKIEEESK